MKWMPNAPIQAVEGADIVLAVATLVSNIKLVCSEHGRQIGLDSSPALSAADSYRAFDEDVLRDSETMQDKFAEYALDVAKDVR